MPARGADGRFVAGGIMVPIRGDESDLAFALRRAQAALSGFASRMQSVGERMQSVGETLSASLTLPIAALGYAAISAAGEMDGLKKGLAAIEGSAEGAERRLKELESVAALPGLGFKEAVQGDVRLRAVGISADTSAAAMKAFGNAIATVGGGKAELDGVLLALTQIQAKGKVSAEEINQLQERVPQIRKAMLDAFGTADTEALGKRGIGSEEFIDKIIKQFEKLPMVTGGLKNAMENVGDSVFRFSAAIGEGLNKAFNLEGVFTTLSDALGRARVAIEAMTKTNPGVIRVAGALAVVAAAAGPVLVALGALTKVAGIMSAGLAVVLSPVGMVVAGLAAAAAVALVVYQNWDRLVAAFPLLADVARAVGSVLSEFAGAMQSVWADLKGYVADALEGIRSEAGGILSQIAAFWEEHGAAVLAIVRTAFGALTRILGTILANLGDVFSVFLNILGMNWQGVFEGLARMAVRVLSTVADLALGVTETVLRALGMMASQIPGIGGSLKSAFDAAAGSVDGLRGRLDASRDSLLALLGAGRGGARMEFTLPGGRDVEEEEEKEKRRPPPAPPVGAGAAGKKPGDTPTGGLDHSLRLRTLDEEIADRAANARAGNSATWGALRQIPTYLYDVDVAVDRTREKFNALGYVGAMAGRQLSMALGEGVQASFDAIGASVANVVNALGNWDNATRAFKDTWIALGDTIKGILRSVITQLVSAIAKAAIFEGILAVIRLAGGGASFGAGKFVSGVFGGGAAMASARPATLSMSVSGQVIGGDLFLDMVERAAANRKAAGGRGLSFI